MPGTGRPPSPPRVGAWRGPHQGLSSGQAGLGGTRDLGSATGLLVTCPDRGTGGPKALACSGGFDPMTSPEGTARTNGSAQDSGARATSDVLRDGHGGSLSGASSLRKGGPTAHRTHGRAGDAGQHVGLDRTTRETLRSPTVPPQVQRMAVQAASDPPWVFTTLAPRIAADFLREASRHTRKARAPGSDGGTAQSDAAPLDEHLHALPARLHCGRSQAAPIARVWIEKDEGGQRPTGQPAFEDQSVHRAGAMGVEALYAPAFDVRGCTRGAMMGGCYASSGRGCGPGAEETGRRDTPGARSGC